MGVYLRAELGLNSTHHESKERIFRTVVICDDIDKQLPRSSHSEHYQRIYYIILSEDKFTQKIHPDVPALTCMRKAQELPQKDSKKDLEMNGHIL